MMNPVPMAAFAGLIQRREQHRGENRDDGGHDEKLNQGKIFFHGRLSCYLCFAELLLSFRLLQYYTAEPAKGQYVR